MKPLVMSDRREPWHDSYFVLLGSQIIARGLSWPRALHVAQAVAA